jgi:hypothetical protein
LRAHLTSKFAKKVKQFLATLQLDKKKMQNADLEPIRNVAKISLGKIVKEKWIFHLKTTLPLFSSLLFLS